MQPQRRRGAEGTEDRVQGLGSRVWGFGFRAIRTEPAPVTSAESLPPKPCTLHPAPYTLHPLRSLRLCGFFWAILAGVLALGAALSALQWGVNGSQSPFATDVGEIQNALPRWGTIHFTGYPLYTFLGSAWVTLWRWLGVEPAAGSSLWSALWGAAAAALFALVAMELGASGPLAALGALIASLATSAWIDNSLAEIHSMTMAFTGATLWLALRYGRTGARRDLI